MWPAPTPRKKTIATETDTEKKHANGARGETSQETEEMKGQSITFEASDRSRSQPLALIQILASELSLAPIREIAR